MSIIEIYILRLPQLHSSIILREAGSIKECMKNTASSNVETGNIFYVYLMNSDRYSLINRINKLILVKIPDQTFVDIDSQGNFEVNI